MTQKHSSNPSDLTARWLVTTACLAAALSGCTAQIGEPGEDGEGDYDIGEPIDENVSPVSCSPKVVVFPVRGPHNTGYDNEQTDEPSNWTCNAAQSNSDFGGGHLGIDIWGAAGTPIVATNSGTVARARWSSTAGWFVRIQDACGWGHYSGHLSSIAPGIHEGGYVTAGTVIGYLGNTGSSSGGVNHLHFSLFPDGNYNAGINPHPYVRAVESNVCTTGGAGGTGDAYQPFGMFDHLDARGGGKVGLYGWAADPDTKTKAIQVHVYMWGSNGVKMGPYVLNAAQLRADVGSAYPGYGNYHGFGTVLGGLPKGTAKVQVFAIDSSNKPNDYKDLGAKWVKVY